MTHTKEILTPEKTTEKSLSSLAAEIADAEKAYDIFNELVALEEERNPEFGNQVDAIIDSVKDTTLSDEAIVLDAMKQAAGPEFQTYLDQNGKDLQTKTELARQLRDEADEIAKKEITQEQYFVQKHVDFDELVVRYTAESEEESLYKDALTSIHQLLTYPTDYVAYENVLPILEQVRHIKQTLSSEGLVEKNENESEPKFTIEKYDAKVETWERRTFEAIKMASRSRQKNLLEPMKALRGKTDKLRSLILSEQYFDKDKNAAIIHPTLAKAIQNNLDSFMDAVDEADLSFINRETESRPNSSFISGVGYLKETTGLDDPITWVNEQLDRLPDWARDGLGFIKFTPGHRTTEHDKISELGGVTIPEQNTVEVSIRRDSYDKLMANEPPLPLDAVQEHIRNKIKHTILHEVMHYTHTQRLPISELREWIKTSEIEDVAVTDYSAMTREHGTAYGTSALNEDLADSVALYTLEPQQLLEKAPERLLLIQEWFQSYPPKNIELILDPDSSEYERTLALYFLVPKDEAMRRKEELEEMMKSQ